MLFLLQMLKLNEFPNKSLENNPISSADDKPIAIINKDDELSLCKAIRKLNKNGGTIYINTPVINLTSKCLITLRDIKKGGLIGVKQPNDEYPRLDCTKQRKEKPNEPGIKINGSNKFIKYLIIENSGEKGIWIRGNNNLIDHVISRYNNASGIQISHGGESNTINYSYSYRNCDLAKFGGSADGFSPKLNAKKTIFNYCYSWDNSDDGWDSFDKEGNVTDYVEINHCACWNNGNVDVFTGKYDYNEGKELDKNMWTIQMMMESDSNFENNYKNKKFSYDKAKINGIEAKEWVFQASSKMNPNGFKLGSAFTPKSKDIIRKCDFCVAFDHNGKGFDNNNSQNCTGYFTNCISFNNRINYSLPYTFAKWDNNWSWNPKLLEKTKKDQILKKPNNINSALKNFYSIREQIIKTVTANKFPDNINFDEAISNIS